MPRCLVNMSVHMPCPGFLIKEIVYILDIESFKVTVHIGTDQNIEIEIFAEYKCTLNEFPFTNELSRKCYVLE